jgi:hypothetical protein
VLAPAERGAAARAEESGPAPQFSSLWDAIPPECKSLVYSHLTQRDMARVAPVCRSFAEDARTQRASVTVCNPPHGALAGRPCCDDMHDAAVLARVGRQKLSFTSCPVALPHIALPVATCAPLLSAGTSPEMVKRMVAAFAHAGTVRLSRCLDAAVLDLKSQTLAAWEMHERVRIADVLAAVAAGSAARRSCGGCSVHNLEICHVDNLNDEDVEFICCSFHSLRCVRLVVRHSRQRDAPSAVSQACMGHQQQHSVMLTVSEPLVAAFADAEQSSWTTAAVRQMRRCGGCHATPAARYLMGLSRLQMPICQSPAHLESRSALRLVACASASRPALCIDTNRLSL